MDDGSLRISPARDARRQGILDIAREIFVSEGFAAASMSAIAARLGGSKGTLYNYFPSKEALFAAVIRDECDVKMASLFDGLTAEGEDVEAVMREVGLRYVQMVLSDRTIAFSRAVIAESVRFPDLGRALNEAGPQQGRRRLAAFVEQAMKAGRLCRDDAARLVEQYCELCLAGGYRSRLMNVTGPPSSEEIAENVEAALKVILAAYAPERIPADA
jgi:AcrR family transcriptional regulator